MASGNVLQRSTKIIGISTNYIAHLGERAPPKEPVLFLKPTSSFLENGGTSEIPEKLESLRHEVELAIVIGKKARDVSEATAMDYVEGYALALDMTAKELQASAKAAGLPWAVAKGQDTFTPISSVLPKSMVPDPDNLEIWLKVDGELRQKGSPKNNTLFKVPFIVSCISSLMTLFEGDVILTDPTEYVIHKVYTGTPLGCGPVKAGQKITAGITGHLDIHFNVERRQRPARN